MFHAQWFQHGAQIMLQETAHPQGLFLLDECEDQPVDAIYRKANIRVLDATEEEPGMSSVHNNFFTGWVAYLVWGASTDQLSQSHVGRKEQRILPAT